MQDVYARVLLDGVHEAFTRVNVDSCKPLHGQLRHGRYVTLLFTDVAELPDIPRPSQLWKRLPPERKLLAADAFWRDENAAAEQAEAVVLIAQRIKFRVPSVQKLPVEKKSRHLVNLGGVSEIVAARLLVAYHLHHQRPMMAAFLDALGVPHENGLIADEELQPFPADRLREAARILAGSHPAEDVSLYLSTLMWQDPETWAGLADAPELALPA